MAIADDLLEILVCPETRQSLTLADDALLARLNERVRAGTLRNRGGEPVSAELRAGLVREDGAVFYAIDDDIPVMLIEESIALPLPDDD